MLILIGGAIADQHQVGWPDFEATCLILLSQKFAGGTHDLGKPQASVDDHTQRGHARYDHTGGLKINPTLTICKFCAMLSDTVPLTGSSRFTYLLVSFT